MDSPDTSMAHAPGTSPDAGLRRRLLGAGLVGLVGSLVPSVASRVSAAPADDPATTTTAPPQRPTDADVALLQFAQTIELAAVDLYDVALGSSGLGDDLLLLVTDARASHLAYAQSLSAMLGTNAAGVAAADVVDAQRDAFAGSSDAAVATAAHDFEDIAVATHTDLLAQLLSTNAAALIASILIVEARYSLVFGRLADITVLDELLLTNADALVPGKA
jgi:hypothetical protein